MATVAFSDLRRGDRAGRTRRTWDAVREAGHRPVLVANPQDGEIQGGVRRAR